MSFRDKFISAKCYLRSICKQESDLAANRSLFEREWEVYVVKWDPSSRRYASLTLCCDSAPVNISSAASNAAACC